MCSVFFEEREVLGGPWRLSGVHGGVGGGRGVGMEELGNGGELGGVVGWCLWECEGRGGGVAG